MDANKMREQFEQWAKDRYSWHLHDDARDPEDRTLASWNGDAYGNRIVEGMWQAWQASRDAVVVHMPSRSSEAYREEFDDVEGGSFNEAAYIRDVRKAIEAQGVKCK
ncbi:hypothetical protein [Pseudomonas sp. NBRC 111121]|uniref:hypothetical protein n=1 Tax=Pseudomonas sp. NBRC 111121 TaxID=1661036 RepID=UPI00076140CD|nr:hypothetical protein [Pseudomonas sp. NBRC 111121]